MNNSLERLTMFKLITLLLAWFFISNINAQNWTKVDTVFSPSGVTVQSFSAPVFGDLDSDGDFDLVLGNIEFEIEYFENTGTPQQSKFQKDESMFTSIYAGGYQFTNSDYPFLVDLDADNDLDLIIGGYNGLKYYENTGDSVSPEWFFDSLFADVNEEIGSDPKPAFADLDDDGDFDLIVGIGESLLGGPEAGICMGFRNSGTAQEPVFTRDDDLVSGIIDVGINAYPAFADFNNDGDYDLLLGRDGATVFYYENTGTPSAPAWTLRNTPFNVVETTNYWKDPTFVDLDGDEDYDLVYGTDDGDLYFYENIGTKSSPQFQHNSSYFKVIKTDGWSAPSFTDYDNDGDYDLLSGSILGKLMYAQNNGTSSIPLFSETTSGFTNISPGFRSAAVFVDIDNDGDYDIVSGYSAGTLILYENNDGTFTANANTFPGVSVSYGSMPTFADIDGDGDLDLLVGSDDNNTSKFYLNEGNNTFTLNTTLLAGVSFPSGSAPAFVDIDNDEDYDLFIGRLFGSINFYENIGTKTEPSWQQNNVLLEGIETRQNAHPGFADLDGDGTKDMILGEADGNFTFYKNNFAPTSVNEETEIVEGYNLLQNYPNPFNPSTKIQYTIAPVI
ncbi:MAG: hypothetical protein EHM47_12270, partial [Ignavibacteriales bacterium]